MLNFIKKLFRKEEKNNESKNKILVSKKPKSKLSKKVKKVSLTPESNKKQGSLRQPAQAKNKSSPKPRNPHLRKESQAKIKSSTLDSCNSPKQKPASNCNTDPTPAIKIMASKSTNNLTHTIICRVTAQEKDKFKGFAKTSQLTSSAVLRQFVQQAPSTNISSRNTKFKDINQDAMRQQLQQLSRIGNNLNQSARRLNTMNYREAEKSNIAQSLANINKTTAELQIVFSKILEQRNL
tara:strand:- start:763 stop:1473 length:711 start_codon:yes stop_codon:yes gene_type:complete